MERETGQGAGRYSNEQGLSTSGNASTSGESQSDAQRRLVDVLDGKVEISDEEYLSLLKAAIRG